MQREEILKRLQEDFAKAREQNHLASERFNAVVRDVPHGIPHPDGTQRVRNASHACSSASKSLMLAVSRLNAFVIHGTVPEDLK